MTELGIADSPVAERHAVKFYGNDDSLFSTVAGFLAKGLVHGEPAVVIATEEHRSGIIRRLGDHFVDVPRATRSGDLLLLDARELLDSFMRNSAPDARLFCPKVGGIVERALRRRKVVVRAYGEMVDLLWKDGQSRAAIQLEILWNQLAMQYGFWLLCGYSMGHFYKQAIRMEEVCACHAAVYPDDAATFPPENR
jgi:DcmR-like sensory protein